METITIMENKKNADVDGANETKKYSVQQCKHSAPKNALLVWTGLNSTHDSTQYRITVKLIA